MIATLTPNPAIDMNVSTVAGKLVPNAVNRTRDTSFSPNGKGLNVAFALEHFGVPAEVLGFFAGFTGRYVVEGAERRCPVHPVWVDGETRVTVLLRAGDVEYTMPGEGSPVPPAAQEEMLGIVAGLGGLETLVVSGSLPPLVGPDFFDRLVALAAEQGFELVWDVSSAHLARLVETRPLLIKPNDDELRRVFGLGCADDGEALASLRDLAGKGARNVLLTLGGRGAYFYAAEQDALWRATAPRVKVLQTACAGDGSLGAFLSVWLGDRHAVEPALKRAMATGANVAMGPGLGDLALAPELEPQVVVTRVA